MKHSQIKIKGSYSLFKSLIHIVLCNADYICNKEAGTPLFKASKIDTHLHISRLFQNKITKRLPGIKYQYRITLDQAEILKEALENFQLKSSDSEHTFFIPTFLKKLTNQIATKKIEVINYTLTTTNQ